MATKFRYVVLLIIILLISLISNRCHSHNLYFKLFDEAVGIGHWESDSKFNFDENDVILVDSSYNIVTISQYAIKCFGMFEETRDSIYLYKFLNQYIYLNNKGIEGEGGVLYYTYDYSFHNLPPGWTSGLAQAEVAMVFFRYNCLYPSTSNSNKIRRILNYMIGHLSDVSYNRSNELNSFFIHEYKNSSVYNYVLNGNLIGLIALIECNQLFEDKPYTIYINAGVEWLESELQNYFSVSDKILHYDLKSKSISHPWYMKAVFWELNCLAKITNNNLLDKFARLLSYIAYNRKFKFTDCRFNNLNFISSCNNGCRHENCFIEDKDNFQVNFYFKNKKHFSYTYILKDTIK